MKDSEKPIVKEDEKPEPSRQLTRRQFLGLSAAGAISVFLAGCTKAGREAFFQARFKELSGRDIDRAIARLEKEYSEKYGQAVTVSATRAAEGVLFAYALDISRCIGCRRCVYACVDENNQSRDPQIHWIRVFSMEKEKGVDFTARRPLLPPGRGPRRRPLLHSRQLPAVRESALHQGLPHGATWAGEGRHRGHRLRLVHRLPLLHGGLPLRRAALQLETAHHSRKTKSTPTPITSATARGPRAWSRSAPSASSARARPLPRLRRGLPGGRAQVRQHPRPQ